MDAEMLRDLNTSKYRRGSIQDNNKRREGKEKRQSVSCQLVR